MSSVDRVFGMFGNNSKVEKSDANSDGDLNVPFGAARPPQYIIKAESRLQGDVDNDGKVANSDLIMVARYVVDIIDPATKTDVETYGDMNGDGVIANADIITIARIIVGLD